MRSVSEHFSKQDVSFNFRPCGNVNFGWRQNCNRCQAPKPGGGDSGGMGK